MQRFRIYKFHPIYPRKVHSKTGILLNKKLNITIIEILNDRELKDKRIAVLMGGFSAERDVSLSSGKQVLASLLHQGYNAVKFDPLKHLSIMQTLIWPSMYCMVNLAKMAQYNLS